MSVEIHTIVTPMAYQNDTGYGYVRSGNWRNNTPQGTMERLPVAAFTNKD